MKMNLMYPLFLTHARVDHQAKAKISPLHVKNLSCFSVFKYLLWK